MPSSGVTKNNKRVLVAMSGGVDSSVAAALLVDQGYDVVGVTMQVWDYSKTACELKEGHGTCCSSIDVDDARSVCDLLGIPFYVLNCEAKFKQDVIDPFIQDYLNGKTPIPCVNCNTFLKFDHLVQTMEHLGCDYLATGHYASSHVDADGNTLIRTSEDAKKDQTYFLFTLPKSLVPKLLFPVGHLEKPKVREIAEQKGLTIAKKRDSTGVCFLGNKSHSDFIKEHIGQFIRENPLERQIKAGQLLHYPSGQRLGSHDGIHQFTYGQRKGIGVATGEPVYVVKIDADTGDVWLGAESALYASELRIDNPNWFKDVRAGEEYQVKIRFQHRGAKASLLRDERGWKLQFAEPQRSITPGQAAVFYEEGCLIGGGWIQ